MFVFNVKMNRDWIKKFFIAIVALLIIIVFIIVGYKFYFSTSKIVVNDDMPTSISNNYLDITSQNYTNILKDSHEHIDKYIGKKIKFTGFVYRLYDFNPNQFVLGREMIISSDNQVVVVGFLCINNCNDIDISKFNNHSWVEVEGSITKGFYHGDLPVIEITCLKETSVPNDEFVYPPDDTYISTEL